MTRSQEDRNLLENRLRQINEQLRILNPVSIAGTEYAPELDYEDLEALHQEREIIQRMLDEDKSDAA